MNEPLRERHESLWWLAAPPLLWGFHLLASYCTGAIVCQKLAGSFTAVRLAIAAYSLIALGALAAVGLHGYRRHRHDARDGTHHLDTAEDRHRFLGLATLLLSGLAALAVCYQALPALFIRSCR